MNIKENLEIINENIDDAAKRSGRNREDITLVAVTKTVDVERINEAVSCGVKVLGENRVQELTSKFEYVPNDVDWHIIGRLQTNKVKYIADKITLLHSVDRLELAKEVDRQCAKIGKTLDVLLEVNISEEETKAGVDEGEVERFVESVIGFNNIRVKGFMTIAPYGTDNDSARSYFARMRKIYDSYRGVKQGNLDVGILSMGMSNDYIGAILEGSNMVRIGSAIFGKRQ